MENDAKVLVRGVLVGHGPSDPEYVLIQVANGTGFVIHESMVELDLSEYKAEEGYYE